MTELELNKIHKKTLINELDAFKKLASSIIEILEKKITRFDKIIEDMTVQEMEEIEGIQTDLEDFT